MVKARYVPEQGDIVFLDFSPTSGHEQTGTRPAVVISKAAFNKASGMALVVPVTSKIKGYPFEVPLGMRKVAGAALADQIRSVDYQARNARRVGTVSDAVFLEIRLKFLALIK